VLFRSESTQGQGSTFWFTARLNAVEEALPVASTAQSNQPRQAPDQAARKKHRILICEDEPINQEIMREILGNLGYAIDSASDGAIAIGMAMNTRYSLILMDIQMPHVDGIEATRSIRLIPGYERIPIVALTANAQESDRNACLAAGMTDFMTKPIYPDALEAQLENWLSRPDCS
jgi:two-component system sensor histidine kinase/response regulator